MKALSVRVPQEVRWQLFDIVTYIAEDSIDNGLAWEARITAAMDALGGFYGHAVDEDASERLGQDVRKTVFEDTYLIHYRIDDAAGTDVVVNVRHGARLPRKGEP